jgi:hypothetical protein
VWFREPVRQFRACPFNCRSIHARRQHANDSTRCYVLQAQRGFGRHLPDARPSAHAIDEVLTKPASAPEGSWLLIQWVDTFVRGQQRCEGRNGGRRADHIRLCGLVRGGRYDGHLGRERDLPWIGRQGLGSRWRSRRTCPPSPTRAWRARGWFRGRNLRGLRQVPGAHVAGLEVVLGAWSAPSSRRTTRICSPSSLERSPALFASPAAPSWHTTGSGIAHPTGSQSATPLAVYQRRSGSRACGRCGSLCPSWGRHSARR